MRIAVAILISSLAISAQADGIYKWVDDQGVVHFGSQPPEKGEVEVVKKPKSARFKQWQSEQQALQAEKDSDAEALEQNTTAAAPAANPEQKKADTGMSKAEQAVRAQRCRMAQSNLQELNTHARVREIGSDGKMRVLPEEERQARIQRAQQAIQINC
ncbi:DUF4124 domain-containing protein [Microbulbifer hainanensis]|uniref:DUF4124 domain-containing protein n=1 Tax=Microbulbifer hainanensis TaxID=2735675 RepID=UPI00186865C5|nr:DUF4124 domain-containing protein [Microbulbifer hainanensis]